MRTWMCLSLLTAFLLAGCASQPEGFYVEADLKKFEQHAKWSHQARGEYQISEASVFTVVAPKAHQGKTLVVFHDHTPEDDSAWRQVGSRYKVPIEQTVFSAQRGVVQVDYSESLALVEVNPEELAKQEEDVHAFPR